ncbi:MAG: glycosyltransferase family 4 protein [Pseudomonadota bacterium]
MLLILVMLALTVAGCVTWWLLRPDARLATLDVPNDRSLHATPVPSGGGLGVLAALFSGGCIAAASGRLDWCAAVILSGTLTIAAVSYVDDRRGLGVLPRLGTHFAVSAIVIFVADLVPAVIRLPGVALDVPTIFLVLGALFGSVWLTNLFNFMDGMDGFAGGMAVAGFSTLALLSGSEVPALTAIAVLAAAGSAGFLIFNFPPARIFMGDVGASALGFLAAALILWGDVSGAFPWWLGALAFAVFIADATVTLGRRAWRGERFWQAHRTHFYQRLVTLGWTHRRTVLMYYCVMSVTSVLTLSAERMNVPGQWLCIALAVLVLGVHMVVIAAWERRVQDLSGQAP